MQNRKFPSEEKETLEAWLVAVEAKKVAQITKVDLEKETNWVVTFNQDKDDLNKAHKS